MPGPARDVENLLIGADGEARHLSPVTMSNLGWQERADLQRWVRDHPDFLGHGLLLITEEFADWEGSAGAVRDRLDLLFLDEDGRLLVVELKRGLAPDRTESQALVYAAYCDQLSTSDVVEQYAKFHGANADEAREKVVSHARVLADDQPGKVRVRLVAEDFPPSVTSTVLSLRELGSGGPESAKSTSAAQSSPRIRCRMDPISSALSHSSLFPKPRTTLSAVASVKLTTSRVGRRGHGRSTPLSRCCAPVPSSQARR